MSQAPDAPATAGEGLREQNADDFTAATITNDDFRLLADNLPTLAWMANADGYIFWYNRRWHEYCGTTPAQMQGWGWQSVHDPAVLPEVLARWRASIAAGSSFEMTFPLRGADGVFRPFLTRIVPVRDAAGQIARWFGTNTDVSAQAAAEAALRANEERLRLVIDSATDYAILTTDPERRVTGWSAGAAAVFGYAEDEILGHPIDLLFTPEDRDAGVPAWEAETARREGSAPDVRWHQGRDGARVFLRGSMHPLRDETGRELGLLKIARDETDAHRTEERRSALLELADRSRDLTDPADLAYAGAEILGRTLGVSRAGYGTVDAAAETITIERDWNAPGIRSLAGVLRFRDYGSYIEDLKRGETVVFADAEWDPRTAATAGALAAISARAAVNMPITERGGFVALLYLSHATAREWTEDELAFVREVAGRTRAAVERRRAEQELRALAASLEGMVEERTAERDRVWRNSRDLLAVVGADGVFRAVNPAWAAVLGHAPEEVAGRSFLDFIWPEDAGPSQGGLDDAATGRNLTGFENRYRHKDGTARWISWNTSAEGGLVYAYGRDVTAEKEQAEALCRAEEHLRQLQKMEAVGQLTGGLAHDFNNLLTGISGNLELLQARAAQGRLSEADRYVVAAQGAAKRAAALTHRLLAFSRRQTLDPKPTDVNRLVAGMEELIRRTVGPAVTVEVVAAGRLWATLIDPPQLENALLNLCINARDAMPDGGRLTVETGNKWLDERAARECDLAPGQYVSLCVSDTGTGMTPEVAARAFDPFFTTKPIGVGTGLGLSMVYGFVRQSGGQARIYSEPGQGAMVRLYLPRHHGAAENEGDADAATEPAEAPRAAQGKTVLVVDDEPTVRMLVTEVLEELGYTPIEAADGQAGLKVLRSDVPLDLLITDVGLPGGLNDRQVADAGRAVRPVLPVLFITGYAENAVVGNGLLEPGMQVLTKPFAMDVLAARVRAIVEVR